jgi:rRNA-processing protein FCF1
MRQFDRLATTPNVLTEVSNMAAQIGGEAETKLRLILAALLEVLDERYVPSREACRVEEFRRLGLTDASLLLLAKQEFLVLTDDRHLYTALQKNGVDAINFNHLRDGAWG